MRFGFISDNSYVAWGGSEELWAQSALHLIEQGASISFCVHDWQPRPPRIAELLQRGAEIHLIRRKRFEPVRNRVRHVLRLPPEDMVRNTFERMLQSAQPDLIVISQTGSLGGVRWATQCVNRKLPFVLLGHGANEHTWPNDWEFDDLVRAHRTARAVYYVSEHSRRLTCDMLGMDLPQASIVRNPFLVPYDSEPTWPDAQEFHLACVGRLDPPSKGQDILFRVLAQGKWRQRPLTVSIFGAGPNGRSLEALAQRLKLTSVRFAGQTNDVPEIWRTHHALVLPSRAEGLPLVVVEAMLCHRIGIVANSGGNTELIEHERAGFVADTPTVTALDAALERAWQRREEWREMGLAAGQRVRALIPREPARVFAEQLLSLASNKGASQSARAHRATRLNSPKDS